MASQSEIFQLVVCDGQDLESYLTNMRQEMMWGGYPEQMAIEELYDRYGGGWESRASCCRFVSLCVFPHCTCLVAGVVKGGLDLSPGGASAGPWRSIETPTSTRRTRSSRCPST